MTWDWLPQVLRIYRNMRGPCSKIPCIKVHGRSKSKLHLVLLFFEITRTPKHRANLKISHRCFCKVGWRCKRATNSWEEKAIRRARRRYSACIQQTREESRFKYQYQDRLIMKMRITLRKWSSASNMVMIHWWIPPLGSCRWSRSMKCRFRRQLAWRTGHWAQVRQINTPEGNIDIQIDPFLTAFSRTIRISLPILSKVKYHHQVKHLAHNLSSMTHSDRTLPHPRDRRCWSTTKTSWRFKYMLTTEKRKDQNQSKEW